MQRALACLHETAPWTRHRDRGSHPGDSLRYTVAEHSRVVERFVTQLGLEGTCPR